MLLDTLKTDMIKALKSADKVKLETLRFLIAAVNNTAIAKYGNNAQKLLTDTDVTEVIKKQVKTHKESIEAFLSAKRDDLAGAEKAQLSILEAYLPRQISDSELRQILEPVVSSGETNFGLLMKQAMAKVAGQADGGRVSAILRLMIKSI